MENQFERTQMLLGEEALEKLNHSRVIVFGVGGVGGYVTEALARSGVGQIDIVDKDTVSLTNLNRQIIATRKTLGLYKVDVMKERIADINPDCKVNAFKCFYLPETKDLFDFSQYDYVIDAVDTVTAKIQLILQAKEAGTKIICSMGAGNKIDPTKFQVADISKTTVCPLARVMRQECKKRGIKDVKVVYSTEVPRRPVTPLSETNEKGTRKDVPGSIAFVPSAAGLLIAAEVVKELSGCTL